MKISILIPAFNEEKNIESTLRGLADFEEDFCVKRKLDMEIFVIDDGSADKTSEKAAGCGAKVIRLEKNMGKGGALRHGAKNATGDIIVFLDADLRESSREVRKLIEPIMNHKADVTIAKFKPVRGKSGFGLVKALAYWGIKYFTGKSFSSSLSGQRAFRREVLESIGSIPDGYGLEVGMLIDMLKKGFCVMEVPVNMRHDVTGRDLKGFFHRGRQFADILKVLISKLGRMEAVA
ncbi:MAG: glycosyltransferase family 2 protein [Tepidanaerobacteraceae bacterium]|nr:glycosyltransferase family 2 protein [Tepidanaerobacteraceae bacterium]